MHRELIKEFIPGFRLGSRKEVKYRKDVFCIGPYFMISTNLSIMSVIGDMY